MAPLFDHEPPFLTASKSASRFSGFRLLRTARAYPPRAPLEIFGRASILPVTDESALQALSAQRNFYAQKNDTDKQQTLRKRDRAEALRLLAALNGAAYASFFNLQMARVHLTASEPKMARRTWSDVFVAIMGQKHGSTLDRWESARKDQHLRPLLGLKVIETTEQIVCALKQAEAGEKVGEICRKMGVIEQTFYGWHEKSHRPVFRYNVKSLQNTRHIRKARDPSATDADAALIRG